MFRYFVFCLMGILIFSGLALPLILRQVRLHSVYGWMLASAFIGLVLRPIYMLLASSDRAAQEAMFWRDVPTEEFILPAALVALGGLCISVGYVTAGRHGAGKPSIWEARRESARQMRVVSTAVAVIGLLAAVQYVNSTGGFDVSSLSTKRVVVNDAARASGIATFGPTLAIGRAGLLASIVLHHSRKSAGLSPRTASVLLLGNLFLPFYASDRTGVLLVVLQLLAMAGFRSGDLDRKKVIAGVLGVLVLLQVLTGLRVSGRSSTEFSLAGPVATADILVFNRSLFDLSKNLHIVRETGESLELRFGETLIGAVVGPVPRAVWPGKPIVSVGPEIGQTIYGTAVTGVPPGWLGEAYWNFHLPGMLMAGVAFGVLSGRLDRLDPRRLSPFFQVAFAIVVLPLGYNAVASSVAGVALDVFRDGLTLLGLWVAHRLLALSRRANSSRVVLEEA